ncbi:phorbol-12-myristate-13-acetate-induced protein 1 [Heteronotia binoei]|uniref:phorbol-12-myristate-13-acetate-induced protein 1 n=1 Tax=Heteronotia binoei TaxID=13085 RepID=UPI00292FC97E|nr:phorbol-12-myristate-13-acetate-induced protein 1 [Heteronotia binoei]
MMPSKTMRKPNAAPSESETVAECALQLRKIGDKLNLHQRILNLIAKLFCPGAQECLE